METGSLYVTTPPGPGGGSNSLALNVDGTGLDYGHAGISLDFCPGAAPATGIQGQFHISIWFKPTDGNGPAGGPAYTYLYNGGTGVGGGNDNASPANVWFEIATAYAMGASVSHVDVSVDGLGGHKGILYFDNAHFD